MDGHTVEPLFFSGGDLERLAISGTVNDTSVMGARPIAVLDSIVVEEGYRIEDLQRLVTSMDATAKEADVMVIGGDFKVMPKGHLDGAVIATCGVGILEGGRILDSGARPGDIVLVIDSIGNHGIALMSAREGLSFETKLQSDVAPIWATVEAALGAGDIHAMKDPTRGGMSSALNDIAAKSGASIWLDQERVPIKDSVMVASDMLGLDPFEVACEGRAVMCVRAYGAESVLEAVRKTSYGEGAEIIWDVQANGSGYVLLRTLISGT
jgi:hydrogenase expression/formation protein HypE